jgi:hypothetical protein
MGEKLGRREGDSESKEETEEALTDDYLLRGNKRATLEG